MVPSDQNHSISSASPQLFDVEPLRFLEQNCLEDVVASLTRWLGRNHELMYANAWNFAFLPEIAGQSEDIGDRLQARELLYVPDLELFHGLRDIEHELGRPVEALQAIQQTLEAGVPVVLGIDAIWVPWADKYQLQKQLHSCIVVGMDSRTQDLYCTDPYYQRKGALLPRSDYLKGYLFFETFEVVADECTDLSMIISTIIGHLQAEIEGNRPFLQMRDLANVLSTSYHGPLNVEPATDFLEIPLFAKLSKFAEARIKSFQLFNYLAETYDERFSTYAERFKKAGGRWRSASAMLMKMHLTSRWSNASLQKVGLQILSVSVEEQTLIYELLAFLETFEQGDASGKATQVDTLALADEVLDEDVYVAPGTALEAQLVELWKEALGVEQVGIQDNFFALGGQSLKAASLLGRMNQQLNRVIPISLLFQYPTVQELAQYLSKAQETQSQAADEGTVLSLDTVQTATAPFLARRPQQNQEVSLVSFAQQRLWLLDQLRVGLSPYYLLSAIRLDGTLHVAFLQRSLDEMVRRHEVLRTTFLQQETDIFQHVSPPAPVALPLVDLQALTPQQQDAQIRLFAEQDVEAPFALSQGPLFRITLLRLASRQAVLLLAFHHIVTDGWSLNIFVRDLVTLYQALVEGQSATLPALPIQYADYALWQRQWLQGEVLVLEANYWKERLKGATGVLALPHDYPYPPVRTFRGATRHTNIAPSLELALTQLSQREGVTLFMTLLAALKVLLVRYSGQSDIAVGTSLANRAYPETEDLLGLFVNTVVLRTDLAGNPSFQEVLKRVRETTLGAYEHQDLPFEQVVEALQPERTLSITPFFQVFFVLQDMPEHDLSLPDLQVTNMELERETVEFDLVFSLERALSGFDIRVKYNPDLFEAATVARLLRHYKHLLTAVLADATMRVAELPLLSGTERTHLLLHSNATAYPLIPACLPELLAQQVARTPHALAARYGQEDLSYQELDCRANQLAHYLRRLGVGPEQRVGVALERSLDLVIALLAILKAGGAYVPLDPGYPAERLAFIARDAAFQILLTRREVHAHLPSLSSAQVIELDQEWSTIAHESSSAPYSVVVPENAAYIIYTSGSTGRPKGAVNTHAALVNRLLWMQRTYGLSEQDRVLQKTPYSFDVSVWEFFLPLLSGACLVLARPEGHRDSRYLVELIRSERITTLHFVPSMLVAFLEEPELAGCVSLKRVFCSGEALPYETQERFWKKLPPVELHNLYGPTEAAIDVSFWHCDPDLSGHTVPIGRPIDNVQLYVLDQLGGPVPIGVAGELFIGGVALARGYTGAPDLTAEKFLPDPFSSTPGSRLYRTGDLVRYRADGAIEYLGRIDHQVKVRGFRIELGEIETVLAEHPAIQESIVLAQQYAADDTRLVSYVVPDAQAAAPLRTLLRLSREGRLEGLLQHQLANGMLVICKNKAETDFVQHELFGEQSYARQGIALRPGDCVFDVGANIGLFTLWVNQHCPGVRVYAFEPVPPIFEILSLNSELYHLNTRLFACGLTDDASNASATLTYYPHNSIISGRFADLQQDKEVVKAYLHNQQQAVVTDLALSEHEIDELLQAQLLSEEYTCEMSTISSIIAREGISRIDLLKIDVEKSEMDVLTGILEEDWQKIKQFVIEVHDIGGRLAAITQLLQRHGFLVGVEEDRMLANTGLFTLYAHRSDVLALPDAPESSLLLAPEREVQWTQGDELIADIQQFLQQRLPTYMLPSAVHLLDVFPLLPNGKIDRPALPSRVVTDGQKQRVRQLPQTPTEQAIAMIWQEILKIPQIDRNESFFDLGGHSLLAIRVLSSLSKALGVQLSLRELFAYPTLVALAACVERASQQSPALGRPQLQPISRERNLPLSFAQQRLWFLDQLVPQNHFYNLPFALRLVGTLDQKVLDRSFTSIVERHEVLRTTFVLFGEEAVQRIAASSAIKISFIDLSDLDQESRRVHCQAVMVQEVEYPFHLKLGPLLRVSLVRIAPEEHIVLVNLHHTVADAWSMEILMREFTAFYRFFTIGSVPVLPVLSVQYADFAAWQREWLQGDVLEQQVGYWQKQLAGAPPLLELPLDYPRPPVQTFRGGSVARTLSGSLAADLHALSRREGVTLFMLLLAAFQSLLYRYSGQPDIVVGTPIANRSYANVENLIGFFVNTLALRCNLAGPLSFRGLLEQVKRVCLDAYAHQDLPFEHLVEVLQIERTLSHNPLFQALLTLQSASSTSLDLPELTVEALDLADPVAKFDLSLTIMDDGQQLTLEASYNSDLFEVRTIQNLLGHYETFLQGVVADPTQDLDHVPLLTAEERGNMLYGWNAAPGEIAHVPCFHEFFQEQARKSPDALALLFAEERITYRELNQRANQLAHYLRSLGVGPERRVIVFVERSPDSYVSLLATLKAGGVYVPIDPFYPAERVAFLLEDAEPTVLLTRRHLVQHLPTHDLPLVILDELRTLLARQDTTDPLCQSTLRHGAYMIYTSGSTGKPKGVLVDQGSLINMLQASQQLFDIRSQDVISCVASFSFDISLLEALLPLLAGGTALLITHQQLLDLDRLMVELRRATVIQMVPSLMRELVRHVKEYHAAQAGLEQARLIFVGGEAVPPDLLGEMQEVFRQARVGVLYGPTEGTVLCTSYFAPEDGTPVTNYPIGRALPGMNVTIRDAWQQLVPARIPGEIYVGGDGVARGYFKREELTDKAFVLIENRRFYKTGDLARYRHDGVIEYLGRTDTQVKLHGHRVELGEIENALRHYPEIETATVIAREERAGEKRLVAYLVPADKRSRRSATPDADLALITRLKAALGQFLPDYMVPANFVVLDALPLNANGKVDRRALPAPEAASPSPSDDFLAPRTPVEQQLAQIWAELLERDQVGIRDDFFASGGHSLLAVRLMSRIQKQFHQAIPLALLFQGRTVEALARLLEKPALTHNATPLVEFQRGTTGRLPFFCVHPVGGTVFCYAQLVQALGDDLPFYALQSEGLETGVATPLTIEAMAAHYIQAIRAVQPQGPYLLGGWSMGGLIAFEMARQLQAQQSEVGLVVLLDTWAFTPRQPAAHLSDEISNLSFLQRFVQDLFGPLEQVSEELLDTLRALPTEEEQLLYIARQARQSHLLPTEIEYEQIARFFRLFKINTHAVYNYSPLSSHLPLLLLRAEDQAEREANSDGVRELASDRLERQFVPGNHYTMLTYPQVQVVADQLKTRLDDFQRRMSGNSADAHPLPGIVAAQEISYQAAPGSCAGRSG